jgi:hypothetical protein
MKYAAKADRNQKECSRCKQSKYESEFYVDASKKTGLSSRCKQCVAAGAKVWKRENPEKVQADRDRYRDEHKEWLRDRHAKQRYETKGRIIARLGGKCARCGFSDERALQFDHIEGDGSKERGKKGFDWWSWVRKLDVMPDAELKVLIQILCANCNQIKRVENNEYGDGKKGRRESAKNCTCIARDRSQCRVHSYDGPGRA